MSRTGVPARAGAVVLALGLLAGCDSDHGARQREPTTSPPDASRSRATRSARPSAASTPGAHTSRSDRPPPPSTSAPAPPYISGVRWVRSSRGRSLRIRPTANGRRADAAGEGEAWHEVVRLAPDAATPGMRAQFDCHWTFARLVEPDKPTWNLEPWRPVVTARRMYDTRCNPGGPEV